jgi:hypothetical protein
MRCRSASILGVLEAVDFLALQSSMLHLKKEFKCALQVTEYVAICSRRTYYGTRSNVD